MDDVGRMRRFEPAADLADDVNALRVGEFLAAQSALEVVALQKLHGDEFRLARHSEVENADDIAVCDLPGEDQFPLKALQDVGVPGQVPGGTLGTTPPCGYGPCNLRVPWLATGTPGASSAPNAYNAGATP